MAVQNFRASDFPKGKSEKGNKNPDREDNKVLQKEVDKAVRDAKEGDKAAKEFEKNDKEAEDGLKSEINNTEVPQGEQEDAPKKRTRKATTK